MMAYRLAASTLVLSAVLVTTSASGQEQTVKRTELMRVPVEGVEGKESVIYTADFAPGAMAPRHTHPGQEFVYVLEGSLILEPEGKPAQTLKAGETATQPANHVHAARNGSASEPAKLLVILLAETGKPLVVPAK
jgi:quercetin dioxygenase-like cupin family protein